MSNEKLYFFLRGILEVFTKINNRLEIYGVDNIPAEGALICPNHTNFSDPFFIGAAVRDRMLHFLAWHGIGEMPVIGPILNEIGNMHSIKESYGVSLDKEETREAMRTLEELLRAGELCVIFPEGAIKHWIGPGDMHEFKPGAVRLAARAGVPIVPVGMSGTRWVVPNIINFHDFGGPDKGFWIPMALPVKVKIRFGKPFHPDPAAADDKDVCATETERLRKSVIAIMESL